MGYAILVSVVAAGLYVGGSAAVHGVKKVVHKIHHTKVDKKAAQK